MFTTGQALIGVIRFAFVLRLILNQPGLVVILSGGFFLMSSPPFFISIFALHHTTFMCESQLQKKSCLRKEERSCSNTGAGVCSLELQYGWLELQGWRNQSTPSPVYFIIHCIAKLQNLFYTPPSLTSLKPSSISKRILSKAFGQEEGAGDRLSMIEQLPLLLIRTALLHLFCTRVLCK